MKEVKTIDAQVAGKIKSLELAIMLSKIMERSFDNEDDIICLAVQKVKTARLQNELEQLKALLKK